MTINLKCENCCGFGFLLRPCTACEGRGFFEVVLSTRWEHQLAIGSLLGKGYVSRDEVRAVAGVFFRHVFLTKSIDIGTRAQVELHIDVLEHIFAIARNPCCRCRTYELNQDMFGSGFCSVKCMNEDASSKDEYTASYAKRIQACLVERELAQLSPPTGETKK